MSIEEIDHLGVVGGHPIGCCLAELAEADGYCVHRFGFDSEETQLGKLQEMPHRVMALCICASSPPGLFRAVAEYLHLSHENRPTYLFNMTPIAPAHARCIDALLRWHSSTAVFAETVLAGGVRAVENRAAIVLYGSRAGPPNAEVKRFLLGFASKVIAFEDVIEASAAMHADDVASLARADENGLKDFYVQVLAGSCDDSTKMPLVGDEP